MIFYLRPPMCFLTFHIATNFLLYLIEGSELCQYEAFFQISNGEFTLSTQGTRYAWRFFCRLWRFNMAKFFPFSNNYQINYCKLLPPYLNFSLNSRPYFNFINNTKKSMSKQNLKSTGFDATKFVKEGVPLEVVQEIKAAFDLFDSDQGGSVDTKELKAAMTSLGFESKNGSIFQMIADLDSDGNGNIDFPEWLALMTTKVGEKNTRANYGKIFAMYDDERTGFLSAKNLRRVAETLGETITEQEIQELIARADLDQDGLISEEEFYALMTKKI